MVHSAAYPHTLIAATATVTVAVAAAAAAALALSGCHARPTPAGNSAVIAFTVHADSGDRDALRYPVEVAARYSNALSFRVGGKIIARRVHLGDTVVAGEVLARLDSSDAQHQAQSARAALESAEHRLLYAKQQLDRDRGQFARQLIAASQLEQTEDAYASAVAARNEAADQYAVSQNALKYNTLVANHAGTITSEDADTGQVVSAGQPVYQLAWSGDVDVVLDAASRDAARFTIGQPAAVSFSALGSGRFSARVREIAPAVDPQSRTFRVKLTLASPPATLKLGLTGEAVLAPAANPGASAGASDTGFEIPATALFHDGASPAVWILAGIPSRLELRPIGVARYLNDSVVVDSGLHAGDVIVAAGVHTVYAGEPVRPIAPLHVDGPTPADSMPADASSTVASSGMLR